MTAMTNTALLQETLNDLGEALSRVDRLITDQHESVPERSQPIRDFQINGREAWLGTKRSFYWL